MAKNIHIYALVAFIGALAFAGCGRHSREWQRLDAAERVMVAHPDSALAIIDSIDASALRPGRERARYALLKSMALDKNYVDTTAFDVLQPAIDYYLKKGTPDERLRTYYYQGRIYQNRHDYDSAMVCFIRGKEYSDQARDTLTIANLLVAQGMLMYDSNIFEDYIELNLIAAKMYRKIGYIGYEVTSLNNALLGAIVLSNEQRADSILSALEQIMEQNNEYEQDIAPTIFRYITFYGDKDEVLELIREYDPEDIDNDDVLVDIAHAYHRFGDAKNALRFMEATSPKYKQGLRYKTSKAVMYDISDDIAESFKFFREATAANDSLNKEKFYNDLLFLQERYAIERDKQSELRKKDRVVWVSLCIALTLLIAIVVIYYRYTLNRTRSEKLQIERNAKAIEAENLAHRVELLENESAKLVVANTNFTMEQFEQELFSHDAWEEVTISTFRNGGWLSNLNVIEGEVGWTYQSCYEFNKADESVNIYDWPYYTSQPTDTAYYRIEKFTINPDEKSFTFRRTGSILGEAFDISYIHRIVAVDKDRIIFDQGDLVNGTITRTSIQPYEIVAIKKEYHLTE